MSNASLESLLDKAAATTSQSELIEILKECPVVRVYALRNYLVRSVQKKQLKRWAIIHGQTLENNNIDEFKINYEQLLDASVDLSWASFIVILQIRDLTFLPVLVVKTRSYFWEYEVTYLGKALAKRGLIRLADLVQRPLRAFNLILECIDDPDLLSETIYKIITDNKIKRTDRLNMLKLMRFSRKLTLQPCGPKQLAPHFYCLELNKAYLLREFAEIDGLDEFRADGKNFLAYMAARHPYLTFIKLFTKDQLKNMLVEKHSDEYVLDQLSRLNGIYLTSAFLNAFKELLMEGKLHDSREVAAPRLTEAKFIYYYSGITGSDDSYKNALKDYAIPEKTIECDGQTTFAFEELPLEILQLICEELDLQAFKTLSLTSKSLRKFLERFDSRYFERMMKKEFSMIYMSKCTDQSQSIDWRHQLNLHSRRSYGWRTCKNPKEIYLSNYNKIDEIISFDENWLIANMHKYSSETFLWNVKEKTSHYKKHNYFPSNDYRIAILDSSESDFPSLVSFGRDCTYFINFNKLKLEAVEEIIKGWSSVYITAVSRTRFICGSVPELFDIELRETVAKNDNLSHINAASYNKMNQMTAMSSTVNINGKYATITYVLDKNFEITHKIQEDKFSYCHAITWLDEFRFSLKGTGVKIADIRMPRDFVHETQQLYNPKPITITEKSEIALSSIGNFTSNHVLKVPNDTLRLGYVWSLKDFTWNNVVVLPDDVKGDPKCNSRYAAFTTKGNSICLLDFAASK